MNDIVKMRSRLLLKLLPETPLKTGRPQWKPDDLLQQNSYGLGIWSWPILDFVVFGLMWTKMNKYRRSRYKFGPKDSSMFLKRSKKKKKKGHLLARTRINFTKDMGHRMVGSKRHLDLRQVWKWLFICQTILLM